MDMIEKVKESASFLKKNGFDEPQIGIVLGTGLGEFVNHIEIIHQISYEEIPHFPVATVEFHHGKLIYGTIRNKKIVAMLGRFHYYEGYSMAEVVLPIRVMNHLGIQNLLISNAGGCMNLQWDKGELMLITDHINLQPDNPLRGNGAASFGPIFTDMSAPYSDTINTVLRQVAKEEGIRLNEGVYVAVAGPNLETKAEYRFLRQIGADVVGMSTVPEVIAANQMGLPVAAISVLTDECDPDNLRAIDISEILSTAKAAEKKLIRLFEKALERI